MLDLQVQNMFILGTGLSWLVLSVVDCRVSILVFIIKSLLFFLPPAIVALAVHYVTSDLTFTRIAFIVVVFLMLTLRR